MVIGFIVIGGEAILTYVSRSTVTRHGRKKALWPCSTWRWTPCRSQTSQPPRMVQHRHRRPLRGLVAPRVPLCARCGRSPSVLHWVGSNATDVHMDIGNILTKMRFLKELKELTRSFTGVLTRIPSHLPGMI